MTTYCPNILEDGANDRYVRLTVWFMRVETLKTGNELLLCECVFESVRLLRLCVEYIVLSSPTPQEHAAWLHKTRYTAREFKQRASCKNVG